MVIANGADRQQQFPVMLSDLRGANLHEYLSGKAKGIIGTSFKVYRYWVEG